MPKPNTTFQLSPTDMELIETALIKAHATDSTDVDTRAVHDLLGRLHNQKTFFRPTGVYVSG